MQGQIGATTATRRERRAAEMRARIFQAAIQLFAERGLESVTVEQITERADVGKGTFFNYFGTKEAVLNYFGGLQVERLHQAVARGELQGNPRQRVEQALALLATYPEVTPELAKNLFLAALNTRDFSEIGGPTIWQVRDVLTSLIEQGQEAGIFDAERPAASAALFLLGQYFLALLTWCTGFSQTSLLETVQHFSGMALDGLTPPVGEMKRVCNAVAGTCAGICSAEGAPP